MHDSWKHLFQISKQPIISEKNGTILQAPANSKNHNATFLYIGNVCAKLKRFQSSSHDIQTMFALSVPSTLSPF